MNHLAFLAVLALFAPLTTSLDPASVCGIYTLGMSTGAMHSMSMIDILISQNSYIVRRSESDDASAWYSYGSWTGSMLGNTTSSTKVCLVL